MKLPRVQVIGYRIYIDEYNPCSRHGNRLGGGDEAVCRGDNLITFTNTEGLQCYKEGIRSVPDADAMLDIAKLRERRLKRLQIRTSDKCATGNHLRDSIIDFIADALILAF